MLEKTTRINFLFDFYQELLTPKQRNYMEMYYLEDFSLGEISETYGVSRQAVYDNIRRTESMLEDYEEKLHLYEKFQKRQHVMEQIRDKITNQRLNQLQPLLDELSELD